MNRFVNILLIAVLLFCPYVCMADQMQGECGASQGCASSDSTSKQVPQSTGACCSCNGGTSHQENTDGTPPSPKPPKQCLCEGAIAVADVRANDSCDLHLSVIAVSVFGNDNAGDALTQLQRGDAHSAERATGREVCVRVCALLI